MSLAIIRDLTVHPDLRGSVRETYRESWLPEVPPIKQLVRSRSLQGVLRGMHLHKKQWDVWSFVDGEAMVRLYDPLTGRNQFIQADASIIIAIPPGVAHGFWTDAGCILVYALTEEYDGTDEYGFDPFDGLDDQAGRDALTWGDWPNGPYHGLILSDRDRNAPRLADFHP